MRILKLEAENVKRLRAVEITPSTDVVRISGQNGAGKTSVLDAIWFALGGKDALPEKPIRDGEKSATVRLDLGDFIVERKITEKSTRLVVSNPDGAQYPSPQKMLDDLVGRMAFDPLAFLRMKPKEQADMLQSLAGLDLAAFEEERAAAYEARRDANRDVKSAEARLQEEPAARASIQEEAGKDSDGVPVAISLQPLFDRMNAANERGQKAREVSFSRDRKAQEIAVRGEEIESLEEKLAEMKQIQELEREQLTRLDEEVTAAQKDAGEGVEDIQAQIEAAERHNAEVSAIRDRMKVTRELEAAKREAAKHDGRIKEIDAHKAKAIHDAAMPVDGLGFSDSGTVTYNGLPLAQASHAEQVRVSMAMAMAANPRLRVVRIQDGSLLDSASWAEVERMAAEHDYQVWAEVVDESGACGIVIHDGEIAGAPA